MAAAHLNKMEARFFFFFFFAQTSDINHDSADNRQASLVPATLRILR